MCKFQKNEDGTFPSYAWPGGYPLYYLLADSEVICPDCANQKNGSLASTDTDDEQWRIVGQEVHWEGMSMYCVHCNKEIESAYGVPE
jgi:hypothetical protein